MLSKKKFFSLFQLSLFFILLTTSLSFVQNNKQPELVSSYKEYTALPREISYAHLNKTIYLKGEIMGFAAYIFGKNSKVISATATNVYCTITDNKNKIIKSEMILASNGVANGSFQIDSLFTSGEYTFKAYTNWMRNFDEKNYYTQTVKIIDPEVENTIKTKALSSKLDAQFLPEGGHFVVDVNNSVGVIIKDSLGFGVPDISGKVLDSENNLLINFKTNRFGIGKFSFTPNATSIYKVVIKFNGVEQTFPLEKAENKGIALTMNDLENRVALSFRTNSSTLSEIKTKNFTLAIHNGSILKTIAVSFKNSSEVVKIISYEDLSPGVNIFTLFDENNEPILERLFFKYDGINLLTAENPQILTSKDSITIMIPIKNGVATKANNFSVSILPQETKSYNPSNTIISATYLKPYLKSWVENANYYFSNITRKKKFELDNLLLTQGWSSYDWNTIFNNPPKSLYNYENGIAFRANVNGKNAPQYMMYATSNNEMQLFDVDENDTDFGGTGLYPFDNEEIIFSAIKKNKSIDKPSLYLQFSPSTIPILGTNENFAPLGEKQAIANNLDSAILQSSWQKGEMLEEVVVKTNKKLTREDKLSIAAFGKVKVIDDQIRKSSIYLSDYIRTQGFKVYENMGQLLIINPRPTSFGQGETITTNGTLPNTTNTVTKTKPVRVYLNDLLLANTDMLYKYTMDDVDYIFFDKSGASEGGSGAPGVIKIFTDPTISQSKMKRNISQIVQVPLAFSKPKKFYTPTYSSYTSNFYKNYGVIEWFPRLFLDNNGTIQFTMLKPQIDDFKIFLEGTANDGSLISEEKTIILP